ncbi:hypothetical protein [Roseospira navarrensis]|uniref:Uncharacterized protein n=1 Tax=Roseospira navarrensis TaxID=140058 RepID=A0A7X2D554_9PROT|nr:hypothetical protein [Roseospira navarrensis]MQX36835.1 hypothetical protein [Roseospira navarrensis]
MPDAPMSKAQRAAAAPQMGLGMAAALVSYGLAQAVWGLELDEVTVGAWTALCEGIWQMLRRMMEG